MAQQEQEPQSQRKGPPPGWRYPVQAKHRSRLRGWLAQVWRGAKNNAALLSLFGVLLTLLVTTVLDTVLTQLEWSHQQTVANQNALQQQKLENQRAEAARELAEQQSQDESLQTYLGDMGELILRDTSPLRGAEPESEVSTLARAKTLTVLARLDPARKSGLLQFLVEAELVQGVEGRAPVITLSGADLNSADPRYPEVGGANLSGAILSFANLSDGDLSFATLSPANLSEADLSGAELLGANLSGAYLEGADLLSADLSEADLEGADLKDTDLSGAILDGADLEGADLEGAQGVTKEQIEQQAASLKGAIMPNGSKHP